MIFDINSGQGRSIPAYPALAAVIARWENFRTLEDVATEFCDRQYPTSAAHKWPRWPPPAKHSSIARVLRKVRHWSERQERKLFDGQQVTAEAIRALDNLVAAGFLISENSLLEHCLGHNRRDDVELRIGTIAVPTKNRPEFLGRCLSSFLHNSTRFSRQLSVCVCDDSKEAETLRNKDVLRRLKNKYGTPIRYAGPGNKRQFAQSLVKGGLPVDVVDFALFGIQKFDAKYGANRNALLLQAPDELIFMADDDTVCRPLIHPQRSRTLLLTDEDPTQLWCFRDRQEGLRFTLPEDFDVFKAHEEMLGRGVPEILRDFSLQSEIRLDSLCSTFVNSIYDGRGKIIATTNGALGGSGMHSPIWALRLTEPESRARSLESRASYETATTAGELLRVAKSPAISHSPQLMSTFLAVDARKLVPPFLPVGRGEDGLFGLTIHKCFRHSYLGHIPYAQFHSPEHGRPYLSDIFNSADHVRLWELIASCMRHFRVPLQPVQDEQCLRGLGAFLFELGSLDSHEFEKTIRLYLWQMVTEEIGRMEGLVDRFAGIPQYWASDVWHWIEIRRKAALRPEFITPKDILEVCGCTEALLVTRDVIRLFGSLLSWWPRFLSEARKLREQGEGLGQSI